jgi:hypothetical protein
MELYALMYVYDTNAFYKKVPQGDTTENKVAGCSFGLVITGDGDRDTVLIWNYDAQIEEVVGIFELDNDVLYCSVSPFYADIMRRRH